jgi:cytochrome c peroxidase
MDQRPIRGIRGADPGALKRFARLPINEMSRIVRISMTNRIDRSRSRTARPVVLRAVLMGALSIASVAQTKISKTAFILPDVPQPADNRTTPARVSLGKMLFFDPRLSGSRQISCATCHNPSLQWSDGLTTALGHALKVLPRKTPSIVNSAFNSLQMWDGRFHSLEEQVPGPIQSPGEMNGDMDQILAKLKSMPGYVEAFGNAYPREGITQITLAKAIASFERTIISRNAPFDSWVKGNEKAISLSAKLGFRLFVGKANCVACHQAPNFTDEGFHNIGVRGDRDEGRYVVVAIKSMEGAFRTPSLRNVALTAPYMHNGAYHALEDVIDFYDRGGDNQQNLDPNLKPLKLTGPEKQDLVEFLKSLSCKPVAVTLPSLPIFEEPRIKEQP